jgi:hypothetical protein
MRKRYRLYGLGTISLSLFLQSVLLVSCSQKHYKVLANDELLGTWISDRSHPQKMVMVQEGKFYGYLYEDDKLPFAIGEFSIVEKRVDSTATIWYKVNFTYTTPSDGKLQELGRLSKSGGTWEFVNKHVAGFDKEDRPSSIDQTDSSYHIYYKSIE